METFLTKVIYLRNSGLEQNDELAVATRAGPGRIVDSLQPDSIRYDRHSSRS